MKLSLRCPDWGKNLLIILIGTGILIGILLIFEPKILGAETDLAEFAINKSSEDLKEGLIVLQGNSLLSISTPPLLDPERIQKIQVVVTAYSSSVWETDDTPYITAAGTWVRDGIIANNYLSFGTKIRIPQLFGDKVFIVEDRMHWTKGNYHIQSDLVHLEVLDNNGNYVESETPGKTVVTRFYGHGTPIIRYTGLDDIITPSFDTCDCGINSKLLK